MKCINEDIKDIINYYALSLFTYEDILDPVYNLIRESFVHYYDLDLGPLSLKLDNLKIDLT